MKLRPSKAWELLCAAKKRWDDAPPGTSLQQVLELSKEVDGAHRNLMSATRGRVR